MRYLQLESVLIPILNIKYVKQEEEETEEEGSGELVTYVTTVIYFKDGTSLEVEEDFDVICELLNPI